jgi:hypothetical protein
MLAQHYVSSSSFNAMPSTGVGIGGEPIKHMVRECFPFWYLSVSEPYQSPDWALVPAKLAQGLNTHYYLFIMVNNSGGVQRFFTPGHRVAR